MGFTHTGVSNELIGTANPDGCLQNVNVWDVTLTIRSAHVDLCVCPCKTCKLSRALPPVGRIGWRDLSSHCPGLPGSCTGAGMNTAFHTLVTQPSLSKVSQSCLRESAFYEICPRAKLKGLFPKGLSKETVQPFLQQGKAASVLNSCSETASSRARPPACSSSAQQFTFDTSS